MPQSQQPALSLEPFGKVLNTLHAALAVAKSDLVRDAVVQRFEYTFELSWKTLRRYFLWNAALDEHNVKNLIREAGRQGLIDTVEDWFYYHRMRNMTSHTYDEARAEEVYEAAKRFAVDAQTLYDRLQGHLS